ncbi:hypothetical protein [Komagataeibacter sp. FNDCR2]|uniref:hypothetical protein n=1 Tax=Komagataeibacter sp. FNDCR2 TaxID=2878682 RepID=UPI001E4B690E|nr:hypothetical protein [Komagataeibacter sp. FNDCR2]MCE2576550.1 hypothetical protein [Komagataeibacter sp. FNDCR2]
MDRTSDITPSPRKEPHEEWREALIHAWKNRGGHIRSYDTAPAVTDEGFIFDEP